MFSHYNYNLHKRPLWSCLTWKKRSIRISSHYTMSRPILDNTLHTPFGEIHHEKLTIFTFETTRHHESHFRQPDNTEIRIIPRLKQESRFQQENVKYVSWVTARQLVLSIANSSQMRIVWCNISPKKRKRVLVNIHFEGYGSWICYQLCDVVYCRAWVMNEKTVIFFP